MKCTKICTKSILISSNKNKEVIFSIIYTLCRVLLCGLALYILEYT